MQQVKQVGSTNSRDSTLVKVLSTEVVLTWVSPVENAIFNLTQEATLPSIIFEFKSEVNVECKWSWVIEWEAKASGLKERERKGSTLRIFKETGSFSTVNKRWEANFNDKVLGGKLTVTIVVGKQTLVRTVVIKGLNPTKESVATYIATLDDMTGFEKLLEQETGCKHFINFDSSPIVAFDQGYGITQTTNPAPSYEQVWSWKANIMAGSSVYKDKVRASKKYLSQAGRIFTDDQLKYEVFSRWNGGAYHEWDGTSKAWVKKNNILCDSETGNIGWLLNDEKNKDKTESELHDRDKDAYKKGGKGQSAEHAWIYSGVCYADHVLDK